MSSKANSCDLCGQPIEDGEREYELLEDVNDLRVPVLHLCQWCGDHLIMGKKEQ